MSQGGHVEKGERFIPVSRRELVHDLLESGTIPEGEKDLFRRFVSFFSAHLHHRFHREAERIAEDYRPFSKSGATLP